MDVAVLLFEGFDELDAIGPYEVFRTAAELGGDLDVSMRTLVPDEGVTARHGLTVAPDDVLFGVPDLVVVPGGGWTDRDRPGVWSEVENETLPERLDTLHGGGATIASVCTGAMLLANAGLLDGRPAATHASAADDLAEYDVDVRDERYVDDGTVLTAAGVTAGIDLALHVVERECSAGLAEQVATEIEYASTY
ncbi:DJ-1/PfpI family protein [Halobacterium salinarum]|uniref:DJ-1/PfpI family protein n=1 Tax=Halobacterium salinarum TaxID=2242 RepID=UPI0025576952|nr:DJ-1/PfpI family protein [Halobacterium salinarum]MDL0143418.1 DJ-1/PfpI family protein [Halobacterium salinarum]